jgi:hypothetical protein
MSEMRCQVCGRKIYGDSRFCSQHEYEVRSTLKTSMNGTKESIEETLRW